MPPRNDIYTLFFGASISRIMSNFAEVRHDFHELSLSLRQLYYTTFSEILLFMLRSYRKSIVPMPICYSERI